jgi:3'-phosphoadenosine 5'-phosphosulfate sulfotransferase (PAPS reductase)/FAD synthetase
MDLLSELTDSIEITDITSEVLSYDEQYRENVFDEFYLIVYDIRKLIEHSKKPIISISYSAGKDSSICLIATLEAYRQSIKAGKVEASRKLLVRTIDTGVESLMMQFFVSFGKTHLEDYATKNNINLIYDIITPELSSQYFVRWAGADKLIPNATRNADCSPIMKIAPSLKHLAKQRESLGDTKVINLTGQRNQESTRRLINMRKQKVSDKAVDNVIEELEDESKISTIDFTPIRDWDDETVFTLLRIAGDDPMIKVKRTIPAYFTSFALLLELYGKNADESCQVIINADNKVESKGCGSNSNRSGCFVCGIVSEDRSAIAMSKKPYWNYLGVEDGLRVRDWLFRVSMDQDVRTMHPKSVDPILNRIMFQPNVLKSKILEKMVRYASQLTVNAENLSAEFALLIEQGRENEFPGYKAILEDTQIHYKAKSQLLQMYKSEASKPYMPYFSLKHATLLSFKWGMLGVAAAPYRPLKIWTDISKGVGVIPFPKLNSELPPEASKLKSTPAKEPIVLRFHTKEFESNFFEQGKPFLSYWQKPLAIMDMFEDSNCWASEKSVNRYPFDVHFTANIKADIESSTGYSAVVAINKVTDNKTKKNLHHTTDWSIHSDLINFIEEKITKELYVNCNSALELMQMGDVFSVNKGIIKANKMLAEFNKVKYFTPYFTDMTIENGYRDSPLSITGPTQSTQRVITSKKGKPVVKSTTRCKFYKPSVIPLFKSKFGNATRIATLDFQRTLQDDIIKYDYIDDIVGDIEPIMFNESIFNFWQYDGGVERALEKHDFVMKLNIKHRAYDKEKGRLMGVRKYSNTEPLTYLMQSAGLMINPSYTEQFEASLKRTHLLAEIGAFDLQSLPVQKLMDHTGTLTMTQHRKDKANYLLKVKAERNRLRRKSKAEFTRYGQGGSYLESLVNKLMTNFFLQAVNNVDLLSGAYSSSTNEVQAVKAWFDYYGKSLSDYESFKGLLLSQKDSAKVVNDAKLNMALNKAFTEHNEKLFKALNMQGQQFSTVKIYTYKESNKKMVSNMSTGQKTASLLGLLKA